MKEEQNDVELGSADVTLDLAVAQELVNGDKDSAHFKWSKLIRALQLPPSADTKLLAKKFEEIDTDKNGFIDPDNLKRLSDKLDLRFSSADLHQMISSADGAGILERVPS